ncbi:MAG: hypothetical protein COU09_01665 [Candidatus Harrisonbacteria bacterium CG10_big_fil_rev_8_21_14_0_10_44_23]|uniref:Uncharacterized protein n=1 Tax=Candidatus Harrisonbacteria bacterium CG10_big_fil_rev_8_21_14_0_10_44_23 TaxID=1974585 RepID=A0A2H0UQ90_9BACT|nr:MAG: hypothetical protein COU09_01665 [Candidatus Harrisonbacteria bacterium CG10_big_fil_rev_8_21_14_0_10_44_23]
MVNLKKLLKKINGVASLPTILLFGALLIEVAIASTLLIYYLNTSVYGTRLANEALLAAQSGVDDAIVKIILDKDCPNASCASNYTLTVGQREADVTICKDTCSGSGTTQITSVGSAFTKKHQLIAIVNIDPVTGELSVTSVLDTPL